MAAWLFPGGCAGVSVDKGEGNEWTSPRRQDRRKNKATYVQKGVDVRVKEREVRGQGDRQRGIDVQWDRRGLKGHLTNSSSRARLPPLSLMVASSNHWKQQPCGPWQPRLLCRSGLDMVYS